MPRLPLVVTGDLDLLDDLLRLAAAGGSDLEVAPDPAAARGRYLAAPMVVIGEDQLAACVEARLPRRPRVAVALRREADDPVWRAVNLMRIEYVAELPMAESWLVDRFADRAAPPSGRILAVVGGRGGAGASVLASGLALAAVRRKHRTLLLDADPLGGGLDLLLGWEGRDGLRWPALADAEGHVDPPALLQALPRHGDLVLLSFDRDDLLGIPLEAMAATLDAARRGRDMIVTDLPRRLDDAAVLALEAADKVLLIVPAELRATAAARRVQQVVERHCADLAVVVRGPAPGKLRAHEISQSLGLPLAGALRPEPAIEESIEKGDGPLPDAKGPLGRLCDQLVADLFAGVRVGVAA